MKRRDVMKLGVGASMIAAGGFGPRLAFGQGGGDYPSRGLTKIVPYPPGGIADARGRLMADWLERSMGQQVIVENVPGASGIIGVDRLLGEPADGYTTITLTSSAMVVVPQLSQLDYSPLDVLAPVANGFSNPTVFMVAKDSPYQTIQDIIDDAKERPSVTFASPGTNSLYHLAGEAINLWGGVQMTHVPYTGAAQYTVDLVAGRVDMAIGTMGTLAGRADEVRGLMIATAERSPVAPDLPTAAESGFPDLIVPDGSGMQVHIDTPQHIVERLSDEIGAMTQNPEMLEQMEGLGLVPQFIPAGEYRQALERQYDIIATLIREANLDI